MKLTSKPAPATRRASRPAPALAPGRADGVVRPIFVIGSPRSGTSILTWCLGQHPNILPVEETAWISQLAVSLGPVYDLGTARHERSQLSATGIARDEFYEHFGRSINDLVLGFRSRQEQMSILESLAHPERACEALQISRAEDDPKVRWVDGTPEYSFYVYPLTLLFPHARFIHLVRDVRNVVPSILRFPEVGGLRLVETEQQAYEYWLRTVKACVRAERAFGSGNILRVHHLDLVKRPEETLRACLEFIGEQFHVDCVEPLGVRINSSNVPANYAVHDPATDPDVVREAEDLWQQLLDEGQPSYPANQGAIDELKTEFLERTAWVRHLESEWEAAAANLEEARQALSRLDDAVNTMATEKASLATEKTVLMTEKAVLDEERQRLARALAAAHAESAELRELIASREADHRATADDLATVRRELAELHRKDEIRRVREVVRVALPADATILVVSRGDDELLDLEGREAWHFPQAENRAYAGYHPATSAEAIEHLGSLRAQGAGYIVFPSTALWWLDHYDELREYLERDHEVIVRQHDACVIYALRSGLGERGGTVARSSIRAGQLAFRCNICGRACIASLDALAREVASCTECRSTVRWRSVVHALSTELFGRSLALPDFPERPDIVGLGMSDWDGYAVPLSRKLGYRNTYYHQKPTLDIKNVPDDMEGRFDFVLSSDVFEHVPPPISEAFVNVRRLLKPGGVLVFTVPFGGGSTMIEHFPELYRYELVKEDGRRMLRNMTRDGRTQVFDDLVFHGGSGATLEMRFFSERSVLQEFKAAGFSMVTIHRHPNFEHGVFSNEPGWYPMSARNT